MSSSGDIQKNAKGLQPRLTLQSFKNRVEEALRIKKTSIQLYQIALGFVLLLLFAAAASLTVSLAGAIACALTSLGSIGFAIQAKRKSDVAKALIANLRQDIIDNDLNPEIKEIMMAALRAAEKVAEFKSKAAAVYATSGISSVLGAAVLILSLSYLGLALPVFLGLLGFVAVVSGVFLVIGLATSNVAGKFEMALTNLLTGMNLLTDIEGNSRGVERTYTNSMEQEVNPTLASQNEIQPQPKQAALEEVEALSQQTTVQLLKHCGFVPNLKDMFKVVGSPTEGQTETQGLAKNG